MATLTATAPTANLDMVSFQRKITERNRGWVTEREQAILASKKIAFAGLGGVGGAHFLSLTRFGIGASSVADLDVFEVVNFNRQRLATTRSLGRPKVRVLAHEALTINPSLDISRFDNGVSESNIGQFLEDVDLYVDGLDAFVLHIRRGVFAECARRGIPALTAAPLGFGAAFLAFMPGEMTFEEYFRFKPGMTEREMYLRFFYGLAPKGKAYKYLVDRSAVNFAEHRGPSTVMACDLCAGILCTNVIKILLGRGDVITAPRGLHFDAYHNTMVITNGPGWNSPVTWLKLWAYRKAMAFSSRVA